VGGRHGSGTTSEPVAFPRPAQAVLALAALATAALLVVAAHRAEAAPSPGAGERITRDVKRITHFGIRTAGSPAEGRVARMLARDLRALGYRVTTQRVALPSGGSSTNVVARGAAPARGLVTAHLDGMPGTLAANDNASGTATLLELARRLRGQPVMLAALGAEERGSTGSSIHLGAARLAAGMGRTERARIRIGVNLDMVGLGAPLRVRSLGSAPNRSARVALSAARAAAVPAVFQADGSGLSDHAELGRACRWSGSTGRTRPAGTGPATGPTGSPRPISPRPRMSPSAPCAAASCSRGCPSGPADDRAPDRPRRERRGADAGRRLRRIR
jgi:hypothetical protein